MVKDAEEFVPTPLDGGLISHMLGQLHEVKPLFFSLIRTRVYSYFKMVQVRGVVVGLETQFRKREKVHDRY